MLVSNGAFRHIGLFVTNIFSGFSGRGDKNMKHICGWIILFILIPVSVFGQSTTDPGAPSLYVPEPLFQFEPVVSGQEVSHDYLVYNKGTAELKITSVKTG